MGEHLQFILGAGLYATCPNRKGFFLSFYQHLTTTAIAAFVTTSSIAQPLMADTYCCRDAKGTRICSDVLPPACYNRAYSKIKDGRVTEVEAPLSTEEQLKRDEQERLKKIATRQAREQELMDRALLARYASEQDIDEAEDRELSGFRKDLEKLLQGMDDLKAEKMEYLAALNSKRNKPADYEQNMRMLQANIDNQQKAIDYKKRDIEAIQARYETFRSRFREILSGRNKLYQGMQ